MKFKKILHLTLCVMFAFSVVSFSTACQKKKKTKKAVSAPAQTQVVTEQQNTEGKTAAAPVKKQETQKFGSVPVFNFVSAKADFVVYCKTGDLAGNQNVLALNNAVRPLGVPGELVVFLEKEDGHKVSLKAVFNAPEAFIRKVYDNFRQQFASIKDARMDDIDNADKKYVRVHMADKSGLYMTITEPWQIQFIYSSVMDEPEVSPIPISKMVCPYVEELKTTPHTVSVVGKINAILPEIGRFIPHDNSAKIFRAVDSLVLNIDVKASKVDLSFSADFLNPKLKAAADKEIDELLQVVSKIKNIKAEQKKDKDSMSMKFSLSADTSAIPEMKRELVKYATMDELEQIRYQRQLKKEKSKQEKGQKTRTRRKANSESAAADAEPAAAARRPGEPID